MATTTQPTTFGLPFMLSVVWILDMSKSFVKDKIQINSHNTKNDVRDECMQWRRQEGDSLVGGHTYEKTGRC